MEYLTQPTTPEHRQQVENTLNHLLELLGKDFFNEYGVVGVKWEYGFQNVNDVFLLELDEALPFYEECKNLRVEVSHSRVGNTVYFVHPFFYGNNDCVVCEGGYYRGGNAEQFVSRVAELFGELW